MSLGSIVVRLTMNTADFETDAGRAAKVAEKRAKEIDAAFRKAGAAIGAALGAAAVAVGAAVKQSVDHMDQVYNAAKKVGESTENFSALTYAAGLADVGMDQLVTTMGRLTKSQAAALDVNSQQAKMFKALGIEVANADGSLRSSTDVMLDFADRFQQLKGSPEAVAAGIAIFGKSFQDLIPLLEQGGDEIRRVMSEAKDLGLTFDDEAGAAADQFNDDLEKLQRVLGAAAMEIAQGMLPSLTSMSSEMVIAAKETGNLRDFGEGLGGVLQTLGGFFGYVAGQVRQLGADVAATVEVMRGLNQMSRLDFSGGLSTIQNAVDTRNGMKALAAARGNVAAAQTSLDRTMAGLNYVQYDGPMLKGMEPKKPPRLTLPTGGGGSRKPRGGGGLSEEAREAKRLNDEYNRMLASMNERIALFGVEGEAARVRYDIENGSLKNLSGLQKETLLARAAEIDMMKKSADVVHDLIGYMDEADGIKADNAERYASVLADYAEEARLLGMSRIEQEKYNAAKAAGVDLWSEEGQAIAKTVEEVSRMRELRGMADDIGAAFTDMWMDYASGAKSAKDAFGDFLKEVTQMIARFLMQKAVETFISYLFGMFGGAAGGSSGKFAKYGGGRASGGPVSGSRLYEVGEGGKPELFQQAGRTYLIPGNDGNVVPATSGVSAPSGGMQVIINNNAGAKVSARQEQGKGPDGSMLRRMVIDIVADSMNGGQLGAVTKNRFGLREAV